MGVADLAGNLLDGNGDGLPGSPFIAFLIGKDGGIVPPSQLPPQTRKSLQKIQSHDVRKTSAVDAVLESGSLGNVKHVVAARSRARTARGRDEWPDRFGM